LRDFADFLARADAYSRGEVPVKPAKKAGQTGTVASQKRGKAPAPDVASLVQEAKRLFEHASDSAITVEMIEGFAERLGTLGKKALCDVAAAVDYKVPGKATMKDIIEAVKKRILDRKGSYIRTGLAERPATPSDSFVGDGQGHPPG
jgi:ribosomal protein L17